MNILIKEFDILDTPQTITIYPNGRVVNENTGEKYPVIIIPPGSKLIDANIVSKKIKAECNPYGNPTIGYDDGLKVLEIIKNAPIIISTEDGEQEE